MRLRRGAARALAVAALALFAAAAFAETPLDVPARIDIRAVPIRSFDTRDPERTRFGALEFRGGLELTSPFKPFGGLSAIRLESDGASFLTLSDRGRWFRGRIVYRDGRPSGLADVETAPMLGPDGGPITRRGWYDTESLAEDDGKLYVGVERSNQILRFDYAREGLRARGQPIEVPAAVRTLPNNKGLECLAIAPKGRPLAGAIIAIPERSLDADGNFKGFLIGGPSPGAFSIKRHDDFDVTDCVVTPNGELLVLERYFSWIGGLAMRIRQIPLGAIRPGAPVDGTLLVDADLGYQIDNMEGMGIHRAASGELIVTVVSDDNFSVIQRTILLQFAIVE